MYSRVQRPEQRGQIRNTRPRRHTAFGRISQRVSMGQPANVTVATPLSSGPTRGHRPLQSSVAAGVRWWLTTIGSWWCTENNEKQSFLITPGRVVPQILLKNAGTFQAANPTLSRIDSRKAAIWFEVEMLGDVPQVVTGTANRTALLISSGLRREIRRTRDHLDCRSVYFNDSLLPSTRLP